MKIKKYVAPTMKEALVKMKTDLGEEAVILGSRKISRGGVLDFLGKEMIEVTATNEESVMASQGAGKSRSAAKASGAGVSFTVDDRGPRRESSAQNFDSLLGNASSVLQDGTERINTLRAAVEDISNRENISPRDKSNIQMLKNEIDELRSVVGEVADQMRYQRMPALPERLKETYKRLLDNDLDEKITSDLIQQIYGKLSEEEYNDNTVVEKVLMDEIKKMIDVARPAVVGTSKEPLVIAIIGPSGVGKTTALAKLATNSKFYGNAKVAMITADTYRVAATQQLGTFSEIAEIPMEIVHTPRDMERARSRHMDKDLILLDTPGGSQFNAKLIRELDALLEAVKPDEVHLALSMTSKPKDMLRSIKHFSFKHRMRLLLTKFDETVTFGSVVSVVKQSKIPLCYLTFGQEVPEDIELADPAKIARLVVKNVF